MTDDEKQQELDEIDRLIAEDPNAHLVEGRAEGWLLTGRAFEIAKAALGCRETD